MNERTASGDAASERATLPAGDLEPGMRLWHEADDLADRRGDVIFDVEHEGGITTLTLTGGRPGDSLMWSLLAVRSDQDVYVFVDAARTADGQTRAGRAPEPAEQAPIPDPDSMRVDDDWKVTIIASLPGQNQKVSLIEGWEYLAHGAAKEWGVSNMLRWDEALVWRVSHWGGSRPDDDPVPNAETAIERLAEAGSHHLRLLAEVEGSRLTLGDRTVAARAAGLEWDKIAAAAGLPVAELRAMASEWLEADEANHAKYAISETDDMRPQQDAPR